MSNLKKKILSLKKLLLLLLLGSIVYMLYISIYGNLMSIHTVLFCLLVCDLFLDFPFDVKTFLCFSVSLSPSAQLYFLESLHQRMKEISMCTEEDMVSNTRTLFRRNKEFVGGKSAKDPIIIDQAPSKRDLFAEDADIDQQERVEVLVEDKAEVVAVTEDQPVGKLPVVTEPMNESANIEEIDSKVNENDKELRAVGSNLDKHDPGPHILGVDKNADVQGCGYIDEHVKGSLEVDDPIHGGWSCR